MDKQQIIDYIMHTPSNTNPAMLGQFLDEYSGESEESWNTLFEGEITTVEGDGMYYAQLSNSDYINVDKIKVTFNGVEHVCNKTVAEGDTNIYGGGFIDGYGPDFSNYPFIIGSETGPKTDMASNVVFTESPGTYSIKIEVPQESGSSEDWSTAEVTFINQGSSNITITCTSVESEAAITSSFTLDPIGGKDPTGNTRVCIIPMYKNNYLLLSEQISSNEPIMTDGNIRYDESYSGYFITGDCRITFNPKTV